MTTLLDLAARVEALTGPDREVDDLVRVALGYPPKPWNYTASVDAVIALIERDLPGWHHGYAKDDHVTALIVSPRSVQTVEEREVVAATPALALLSAALRAKAAQQQMEADRG